MIKAGEELLRLQAENQDLKAKVYALSSQIISVEQDKIELREENARLNKKLNTIKELSDKYENELSMCVASHYMEKIRVIFEDTCESEGE